MSTTSDICLSDLPEGILMYIAGFLCLKDFLTLCSVSKSLAHVLKIFLATGADISPEESILSQDGTYSRKVFFI